MQQRVWKFWSHQYNVALDRALLVFNNACRNNYWLVLILLSALTESVGSNTDILRDYHGFSSFYSLLSVLPIDLLWELFSLDRLGDISAGNNYLITLLLPFIEVPPIRLHCLCSSSWDEPSLSTSGGGLLYDQIWVCHLHHNWSPNSCYSGVCLDVLRPRNQCYECHYSILPHNAFNRPDNELPLRICDILRNPSVSDKIRLCKCDSLS